MQDAGKNFIEFPTRQFHRIEENYSKEVETTTVIETFEIWSEIAHRKYFVNSFRHVKIETN